MPWIGAGIAGLAGQAHADASLRAVGHPSVPAAAVRRIEDRQRGARTSRASSPQPLPPGVSLDLGRMERLGWLVPGDGRSQLAEEFRQVKRPLLHNARSEDPAADRLSLIMVTSAGPGEGKTFCATNLAMSIAMEIDTSVLLVDADVVRPNLPEHLGFEAGKGLLDLLVDPNLGWSDVILQTNVPKLSILPAGTRSDMSTELLASDAMLNLLDELCGPGRERVVIFDGPPLLGTSEARVLARRVGQVVLVVEAEVTARIAVAQALAELDHCAIVMPLLNKAHEPVLPYGLGKYAA